MTSIWGPNNQNIAFVTDSTLIIFQTYGPNGAVIYLENPSSEAVLVTYGGGDINVGLSHFIVENAALLSSAPEPSALTLFGFGLAGLSLWCATAVG